MGAGLSVGSLAHDEQKRRKSLRFDPQYSVTGTEPEYLSRQDRYMTLDIKLLETFLSALALLRTILILYVFYHLCLGHIIDNDIVTIFWLVTLHNSALALWLAHISKKTK